MKFWYLCFCWLGHKCAIGLSWVKGLGFWVSFDSTPVLRAWQVVYVRVFMFERPLSTLERTLGRQVMYTQQATPQSVSPRFESSSQTLSLQTCL